MLAHKAEEEGVAVAERMAGQPATSTRHGAVGRLHGAEMACVGLTEEQVKAAGIEYRAGVSRSSPTAARGRWATRTAS